MPGVRTASAAVEVYGRAPCGFSAGGRLGNLYLLFLDPIRNLSQIFGLVLDRQGRKDYKQHEHKSGDDKVRAAPSVSVDQRHDKRDHDQSPPRPPAVSRMLNARDLFFTNQLLAMVVMAIIPQKQQPVPRRAP